MSVFTIAEAGVNHNGRLDTAIKLIHAAKEAGADAVKFQFFDAERLAPDNYERRAMLKGLSMTPAEMKMLHAETTRCGLEFMATCFDAGSLNWMLSERLLKRIKIGSGQMLRDYSSHSLQDAAAASGLPVIMSCGMCYSSDIERAVGAIGKDKSTLLYCISRYPTPQDVMYISEMDSLRADHGVSVGFSSHCPNFWPSVAAVYAGAVCVEQHLTLDRSQSGPDHSSSLEPHEFKAMVREIRYAETRHGTQ